jgi:endonuclease YncB( thermonuclease family)
MEPDYTYAADLIRVIDGDTIVCRVDTGFGIWYMGPKGKGVHVRLHGIDCPDVRYGATKEAKDAATNFTRYWLTSTTLDPDSRSVEEQNVPLVIESRKIDSFGRCIAKVWRRGDVEGSSDLSTDLLEAGHAVLYEDRKGRKQR